MIECLYDDYKYMSAKGGVYMASDTHFDDLDCKLMDPEWISPEEHIKRINKVVHSSDTFIHLGDTGNTKWIKQINGYKVLIMGNHDESKSKFVRKRWSTKEYLLSDEEGLTNREIIKKRLPSLKLNEDFSSIGEFGEDEKGRYFIVNYDNKLFDKVYSGPLMIAPKIILSHEPLNIDWALNIHGHNHSGEIFEKNGINLASNVYGYEVFNLGEYIKKNGLSNVKDIHRQIIDKAAEKSIHRRKKCI